MINTVIHGIYIQVPELKMIWVVGILLVYNQMVLNGANNKTLKVLGVRELLILNICYFN
jgi:hypothetical protein